jgi:hypothetical protein
MDETVLAAERLAERSDEMTPDDYVRLGRAMARVMFAAWRATNDPATGTNEHTDVA